MNLHFWISARAFKLLTRNSQLVTRVLPYHLDFSFFIDVNHFSFVFSLVFFLCFFTDVTTLRTVVCVSIKYLLNSSFERIFLWWNSKFSRINLLFLTSCRSIVFNDLCKTNERESDLFTKFIFHKLYIFSEHHIYPQAWKLSKSVAYKSRAIGWIFNIYLVSAISQFVIELSCTCVCRLFSINGELSL